MGGLDALRPGQIRNGPGQLQNPMIGSRTLLHRLHGHPEKVGTGLVDWVKLADFTGTEVALIGTALLSFGKVCSGTRITL